MGKHYWLGQCYVVPPEAESEHVGHTLTVTGVRSYPPSSGPDPDDGAPDAVTVRCSCGDGWTFEDMEDT